MPHKVISPCTTINILVSMTTSEPQIHSIFSIWLHWEFITNLSPKSQPMDPNHQFILCYVNVILAFERQPYIEKLVCEPPFYCISCKAVCTSGTALWKFLKIFCQEFWCIYINSICRQSCFDLWGLISAAQGGLKTGTYQLMVPKPVNRILNLFLKLLDMQTHVMKIWKFKAESPNYLCKNV